MVFALFLPGNAPPFCPPVKLSESLTQKWDWIKIFSFCIIYLPTFLFPIAKIFKKLYDSMILVLYCDKSSHLPSKLFMSSLEKPETVWERPSQDRLFCTLWHQGLLSAPGNCSCKEFYWICQMFCPISGRGNWQVRGNYGIHRSSIPLVLISYLNWSSQTKLQSTWVSVFNSYRESPLHSYNFMTLELYQEYMAKFLEK